MKLLVKEIFILIAAIGGNIVGWGIIDIGFRSAMFPWINLLLLVLSVLIYLQAIMIKFLEDKNKLLEGD